MTRLPRSRDPAERVLDELLQRAPREPAPEALRRRLQQLVADGGAAERGARRRPWSGVLAPALAAGIVLVAGGVLVGREEGRGARGGLAAEVVNDHLRVLAREQPPDVPSGGSHQVKPWFEGKLDFAPDVPTPAGDAIRLRGGSVGYLFDRKAAVLEYALGGHAGTLLVFRAEGLAWPAERVRRLERIGARQAARDGFNVVLWRDGDLGYALVSDLPADALADVAAALAPAPAR